MSVCFPICSESFSHVDVGVELIDLLPETSPELSTLGFKCWSQEAVLDGEQLCVQSNVLHLQQTGAEEHTHVSLERCLEVV